MCCCLLLGLHVVIYSIKIKCVDNLIILAFMFALFPNYSRIIPEKYFLSKFPKLFPHNSHKPILVSNLKIFWCSLSKDTPRISALVNSDTIKL